MDFDVLILGTDINAYYMARCYYDEYGKKANLLGKSPMSYTKYSNILNVEYDDNLWTEEGFLKVLKNFQKQHYDKKILLISCNETYTNFISKNKDKISDRYCYNIPSINILETFSNKETFYKKYADSILNLPKTYYYNVREKLIIPSNYRFPLIIKPSNVAIYNHLNFKNKIYKVENYDELYMALDEIKGIGYNETLIIQEYIKGDDSNLLDVVVYSDRTGKVKLLNYAQIGLQEHSKKNIGNAAILVTNYCLYENIDELLRNIAKFMNEVNYHGFAEIDVKYDCESKEYKILEINPRQGRCNFYLYGLGYNLVKILVDDLIIKKNIVLNKSNRQVVLSFVPKIVARKYIKNQIFKNVVLKLWKTKISPLEYKKDSNIKRKLFLLKRKYKYLEEYKNGYWINE